MRRLDARFAFACLVGSSVACGGGGSQGGDFGTGLTIDATTLSFSSVANEGPPPAQALHASISAVDATTVGVGYTNGAEQVAWLQASIPEGQSPASTIINFSVIPQFTPGTFTAHPSVAIFRSNNTPIAVRSLTVTYQVAAQAPSVSPTTVALQTRFNTPPSTLTQVQIKGSGNWTASVEYASGNGWLKEGFRTFPDSGPSPFLLQLAPDIATPVGTYAATLHVGIGGQTLNVAVTLEVTP
ncbi:MAG TPA: hypothetical protein VFE90_03735 [Myxococcales bacterium]|jgi:hypothetical protein|nr:hypothetical protein [Myxococcales bacterium]